nr:MAG TPA: hypothetical protein [Caudoviricetes sp.]
MPCSHRLSDLFLYMYVKSACSEIKIKGSLCELEGGAV